MSTIDVLLLDVMGTLVYDPFHREMPAFFGMSLQDLLREKHPDAWIRFEHGELSEADFLASFFADGRVFDHEAFRDTVRDAYRFLDGIEPLLAELKDRGVSMHALSNYPSWYRLIEEELQLSRYLSWSFVSCETGVRKPHPDAFVGPTRALGVTADRCLFVDDREANVEAARAVGMRAVTFREPDALRRALAAHGLL